MHSPVTVLFDCDARILWGSWWHPDYKGGEGDHAWDYVEPGAQEYVRGATMRCLGERVSVWVEAVWQNAGLWRVLFLPASVKNGRVCMVSHAWMVPDAVQRLGERELAVCRLVMVGAYDWEIAEALGISARSVREAKHAAALAAGVDAHSLAVWAAAHRRFLEPL
jgi:hypothetical protein